MFLEPLLVVCRRSWLSRDFFSSAAICLCGSANSLLRISSFRSKASGSLFTLWHSSFYGGQDSAAQNATESNASTAATPATLYWLKQLAGKSTLPRRPLILLLSQCSILPSMFFIARDRRSPPPYHYAFCSLLDNCSAFARGWCRASIGGLRKAMSRLPLAMKNRRANCVASSAGTFGVWARICFAAQNSCGCLRRRFSSACKSTTSERWTVNFARAFPSCWS